MKDTAVLLADFFAQDDLARLTADAGELLDCPLMVIDDAFRVTAHYAPPALPIPCLTAPYSRAPSPMRRAPSSAEVRRCPPERRTMWRWRIVPVAAALRP